MLKDILEEFHLIQAFFNLLSLYVGKGCIGIVCQCGVDMIMFLIDRFNQKAFHGCMIVVCLIHLLCILRSNLYVH